MMPLFVRSITCLLLFACSAGAQVTVVKAPRKSKPMQSTEFSVGAGRTRSVLFLTRNIREDNDARGWNVNITYGLTRVLRLDAEYTWYQAIDIAPTWYEVKGSGIELNLHFVGTMPNGITRFYPLAGLSYNIFDGYFTGMGDHLNLKELYAPGTQVTTPWPGLNVGAGFQHDFGPVGIFGEYKMRVGLPGGYEGLNILDVCFSGGLRYSVKVPAPRRIFKGTRSRYHRTLVSED